MHKIPLELWVLERYYRPHRILFEQGLFRFRNPITLIVRDGINIGSTKNAKIILSGQTCLCHTITNGKDGEAFVSRSGYLAGGAHFWRPFDNFYLSVDETLHDWYLEERGKHRPDLVLTS